MPSAKTASVVLVLDVLIILVVLVVLAALARSKAKGWNIACAPVCSPTSSRPAKPPKHPSKTSPLPPDGGCGRLFAFCRKVAGWPADGGTDIVRELTGGTCARSTR